MIVEFQALTEMTRLIEMTRLFSSTEVSHSLSSQGSAQIRTTPQTIARFNHINQRIESYTSSCRSTLFNFFMFDQVIPWMSYHIFQIRFKDFIFWISSKFGPETGTLEVL